MKNNKQLVDAITEVMKAGTSEGAKKGWDTRKRGGAFGGRGTDRTPPGGNRMSNRLPTREELRQHSLDSGADAVGKQHIAVAIYDAIDALAHDKGSDAARDFRSKMIDNAVKNQSVTKEVLDLIPSQVVQEVMRDTWGDSVKPASREGQAAYRQLVLQAIRHYAQPNFEAKAGTSEGAKKGWEKRKRGVHGYEVTDPITREKKTVRTSTPPMQTGRIDNDVLKHIRKTGETVVVEPSGGSMHNTLQQGRPSHIIRTTVEPYKTLIEAEDPKTLHALIKQHGLKLHPVKVKSEAVDPIQTAFLHVKSHFDDYVPNVTQMMTQWRLQLDNRDFDWDSLVKDNAGFIAATFGLPESVALDAANEMVGYLNTFALIPPPISTAVANQVFAHLKLIIDNRQHMQGSSTDVSRVLTETVLD